MSALNADAHALSAFRVLSDGRGRAYTATTFPKDPNRGCARMVRIAQALGYVRDAGDGYAVLDVLNAEGDIVQDFWIPSSEAFSWWKRSLNLVVDSTDEEAQRP